MDGFIFVEGGEYQHRYRFPAPGIERFGSENAGRRDAVHDGHTNIHHHDIGLKSRDHFHTCTAVASLPDDDHVGLRLQQQGKSRPDQGFVVDKDNPQTAL
ncbi:hypothetical protein GCM10009715_08640 [Paeniglutamicibacter psychrophenolicus]